MKKVLVLTCIMVFTLALAAFAAPAAPDKPLEFKGSQKTVMFPHAVHAKVECVTCHHKVDGKESYAKCATAGCHDNLKDKKGTNSLYYVMHAKEKADAPLKHQSCLSCHVKVVAEKPDLKKDLTGCAKSKCHP